MPMGVYKHKKGQGGRKGRTGVYPRTTEHNENISKNHAKYWEGKKMSKTHRKKIGKHHGRNHHSWKGGRVHRNGYIGVAKKTHPFCDKAGYVKEHRLVVEKHIGRYLSPVEVVHHLNSKKDDNRIENLMLFKNTTVHKNFEIIKQGMKDGDILFDGSKI